MATPTPARRRLEPDARRSEILDAALRIYAEHPYTEVSADDLAREAGAARGLLNHYFGTKRGLYLEALRELLTIPSETVTELPGETHHERVGAAVDWFLATVEARPELWLRVGMGVAGEPDVDAVVAEADEIAVARLLLAVRPEHDPADETVRARARASFGLVRAASREWLVRGALDRAGVRELLVTALVALFAEPPGTPGTSLPEEDT